MFTYHIDRIPSIGVAVDSELPRDTVAFLLGEFLRPGDKATRIRFEVQKRGTNILVDGELSLDYQFDCGRCAESFGRHAEVPIQLVFVNGVEEPAPDDEGEDYDVSGFEAAAGGAVEGREVIFFQGHHIDLEAPISEQIVLALPEWPICRDDCRGLCVHCGQNLNLITEATCPCGGPKPEPARPPSKLAVALAAALGDGAVTPARRP